MTPTRRGVLTGMAATATTGAAAVEDATPLADVARAAGLFFGAAGNEAAVARDPAYARLLASQCSVVTPESAFKFDAFHPAEGVNDFSRADAAMRFADDNALRLRGHTLIWNDYLPAWMKRLSLSELRRTFDAHLDAVVPRYAGRLHSWDVVNEPSYLGRDRPGTPRPGPWLDAFGEDYVLRAFQRAAALDPGVPLCLNEAWTERSDAVGLAVRKTLLTLVARIQDHGLRIDAVGLQAHLQPQEPYDDAGFLDFLHALAARGVQIWLTEFDVIDAGMPDDPATRDRLVAARARAFLGAALRERAVKGVVTWGLSDRYSWLREERIRRALRMDMLSRPLPYDDAFAAKPLRAAIVEAMRRRGV